MSITVNAVGGQVNLSGTPTDLAQYNLAQYCISVQSTLWMLQYSSVRVTNSKQPVPVTVTNDKTFSRFGNNYQVLTARNAGAQALDIDNPFVFSKSLMKYMANAFAFELMIPRPSSTVNMVDPYGVDGTTTIDPLQQVVYLFRPKSYAGPAVTATGRIMRVTQNFIDSVLEVEIA